MKAKVFIFLFSFLFLLFSPNSRQNLHFATPAYPFTCCSPGHLFIIQTDRISSVFLFFIVGAENSLQACVNFESCEGRIFFIVLFWCFYDLSKPTTYCVKPSESTGSEGSHPERVN